MQPSRVFNVENSASVLECARLKFRGARAGNAQPLDPSHRSLIRARLWWIKRINMQCQTTLPSLTIVVANCWLQWPARVTCKALQCDAWATHALHTKAKVSAARLRKEINVILKPSMAASMLSDCTAWETPLVYQPVNHWLRLLHASLQKYLSEARNLPPVIPRLSHCQAKSCVELLGKLKVTGNDIAKRFTPHLQSVAGYLKLCELRIQMVDAQYDDDSTSDENLEQCAGFDDLLAQLDVFIYEVQRELEPYLP